jgi:2-dehydro-3-deoxygalactonokinase
MKIFVDWGSTNFRAFLMDDDVVVDRKDSPDDGVLKHFRDLPGGTRIARYSSFLQQMLMDWLVGHPDCPILMCGAIGSREGWIDTGYTEAPADMKKIALGLRQLTPEEAGCLHHRSIFILPGLATAQATARHDVMRSEDIKSLGAAACAGQVDTLLCVPGTHCKWVEVKAGTVTGFQTIMTGDIYSVLNETGSLSVLFELDDGGKDYNSFDEGFELAAQGQNLLVDLFQVRSRILRGAAPPSPKSFLSGILIGHELRQARLSYATARNIILLSDPGTRQDFYSRALDQSGWVIDALVGSEQAVCMGLSLLQREMV